MPLAALGLLSTLFFFSGEVDPTQSIPYAELNVEQLAREQRVSSPYFAGVTDSGAAITFTGSAAIPDLEAGDRFTLEMLDARFEMPGGLTLTVTAPSAEFNQSTGRAELRGGAIIETSDGLIIETDGLITDFATGDLETLGPITAIGPFGRIRADALAVTRPEADKPHRIVFQGDVEMLYVEDDAE
ncbi:MAG: hypothetical protein AAF647_09495 [Pseudomonadota bacterium]